MTELNPPRPKSASISEARTSAAGQAPHDEEVYGTLGSLLGTLEVIATDDHHPLPAVQAERMRGALRLANAMQAQVEALLMLADDELPARLKRFPSTVRPLVEHAVRGALRGFERANVALVMPSDAGWGTQRVSIDSSRVDRSMRALAEALAQRVGDGGIIEVQVVQRQSDVVLTLRGRAGAGCDKQRGGLVLTGARRLLALHGGALEVDASGLTITVQLPTVEAP
jgi:signal transduction histidine kinase